MTRLPILLHAVTVGGEPVVGCEFTITDARTGQPAPLYCFSEGDITRPQPVPVGPVPARPEGRWERLWCMLRGRGRETVPAVVQVWVEPGSYLREVRAPGMASYCEPFIVVGVPRP